MPEGVHRYQGVVCPKCGTEIMLYEVDASLKRVHWPAQKPLSVHCEKCNETRVYQPEDLRLFEGPAPPEIP